MKSLELKHFRTFDESANVIEFVGPTEPVETDVSKAKRMSKGRPHIAADTTLIIGGNNSGKSTVVHALRKLVSPSSGVGPSDFCYQYLDRILDKASGGEVECPFIELRANIAIGDDDSIAKIGSFVACCHIVGESECCAEIVVRFSPADEESMRKAIQAACTYPAECRLREFLTMMEGQQFVSATLDECGREIRQANLGKLFSCSEVPATDVSGEHCLSVAFGKILRHQRDALLESDDDKEKLLNHIEGMNDILTKCIEALHGNDINAVLEKAVRGAEVKAHIGSDITLEKMVKSLVRYEYEDGGLLVPEDQFGLGYTRLVMVIAHILDYVDQYDDDSLASSVNLVVIEEPETHMHPQMQELFIQYIEDAISMLIQLRGKSLSCQLIITTHSDHIVHSKIHAGGRFDCINYLRGCKGVAHAIPLSDKRVQPSGGEDERKNLLFLKKHICQSVGSVFFADAVVIVEGQSEATLLPYYVSNHTGLKDCYVSILSVGGAHGFVYEKLMDTLGVPTALITDLDIKREHAGTGEKSKDCSQTVSLHGRSTTNETLKHFAGTDMLDDMTFPLSSEGGAIRVYSQQEANGFYPTSFEEAVVLENYTEDMLVDALLSVHPRTFKNMLGYPQKREELCNRSYECQRKLADKKGEFASALLFGLLTGDNEPSLRMPGYITGALDDIASRTKGEAHAK